MLVDPSPLKQNRYYAIYKEINATPFYIYFRRLFLLKRCAVFPSIYGVFYLKTFFLWYCVLIHCVKNIHVSNTLTNKNSDKLTFLADIDTPVFNVYRIASHFPMAAMFANFMQSVNRMHFKFKSKINLVISEC